MIPAHDSHPVPNPLPNLSFFSSPARTSTPAGGRLGDASPRSLPAATPKPSWNRFSLGDAARRRRSVGPSRVLGSTDTKVRFGFGLLSYPSSVGKYSSPSRLIDCAPLHLHCPPASEPASLRSHVLAVGFRRSPTPPPEVGGGRGPPPPPPPSTPLRQRVATEGSSLLPRDKIGSSLGCQVSQLCLLSLPR